MIGPTGPLLPYHPGTEVPDERDPTVRLLELDVEPLEEGTKTTAERLVGGWRLVDWEVHAWEGELTWFARSWHTIPSRYLELLGLPP